jgi:hypothetical protein
VAVVLLVAGTVGCSSSGDDGNGEGDGAPTTADAGPVTAPADTEAGTGHLVLDGERTLLQVRSCALEPTTDGATGVTTELAIDADDGVSVAVSVTRSTFAGDLPTTTDEVLVARDGVLALEAERADRSGTILDVRAPTALTRLLEVDGGLVAAEGVFGPTGSRDGDAGLVEGSLVLRCP